MSELLFGDGGDSKPSAIGSLHKASSYEVHSCIHNIAYSLRGLKLNLLDMW
jgi:hypothetical protein